MHGGRKKSRKQSQDKVIKTIQNRIIRDLTNLFEQKEVDYYKPVRVGNFYNNYHI